MGTLLFVAFRTSRSPVSAAAEMAIVCELLRSEVITRCPTEVHGRRNGGATQLRSILVVKTAVWLFPPRWDCCARRRLKTTFRTMERRRREFNVDGVALQFCQRKWQQSENLSKHKTVKQISEEAFPRKSQNYARARILSTFQAFLASSNGAESA